MGVTVSLEIIEHFMFSVFVFAAKSCICSSSDRCLDVLDAVLNMSCPNGRVLDVGELDVGGYG